MTEEDQAAIKGALIREGVGLLVMAGVLWYLGPGRIWVGGVRHRFKTWRLRHSGPIDAAAAEFARDISRWEHEQAAGPDHRPGGSRPCGCG